MSKVTRLLLALVVAGVQFLGAAHAMAAAPKVTVTVEPLEGGRIVYMLLAAEKSGGKQTGQLSLRLSVVNQEATTIRLNKVTATFAGPPNLASVTFNDSVSINAGATGMWVNKNTRNIILPSPAPKTMTLSLYFDGFTDPATITMPLAPHRNPVTGGAYLFPAKTTDLRQYEYWTSQSGHGEGKEGSQLFGYDMGVTGYDVVSNTWSELMPGTTGEQNTDWRIWSKPVYALADGTVIEAVNNVPSNPKPFLGFPVKDRDKQWTVQEDKYWGKGRYSNGGAGNHFYIQHGTEVVMYAHMQLGSLNKKLLTNGAIVKAGDYLGLAGNSGNSSNPHLHIHAIRGNAPEVGPLRPLSFRYIHVIAKSALTTHDLNSPWVKVTDAGLPGVPTYIWPSSTKPTWVPPRYGAAIVQSSGGNLEVVAHEGKELYHWYMLPGKAWTRAGAITSKSTGPGSITQSKNGGNFEVLALEGSQVVHYTVVHYTAVPGKAYTRGAVLTSRATGPGSIILGSVGNLEAVILEGNELAHYYCIKGKWSRGVVVTNKATGPGTMGPNMNGNFEVVVLEGKDLVHYWCVPGKGYNRGDIISNKATGPGSIVHAKNGNLEVIVPEGSNLVHYWYDKTWHRGNVVNHSVNRMGVGAICRNRNNNLEAAVIEGNQIVHYWEVPGKGWTRGSAY